MCPNVYEAVFALADAINKNKEMLTDLDAAIGDADHGINMSRGFDAVRAKLAKPEDEDISAVLKKVGMTLISTVGGASGPLYGTAFLKAAGVVQGCETITGEKAAEMLSAAVEGIKLRGKAKQGDKTMLDALEPALEAISGGVREGRPLIECLEAACDAAEKGMLHTSTIKATKGRASYLGDRSIGHQDPGATSSHIMLKALTDYYRASMQGI
ncbi:MAG TPA: dihydroxyacetone kinase subunit DhaL [Negativicutes bacterium]|nr:dihydroxyacetone kinase subunit DhaL [Negativicutes bacterium]